MLNIPLIILVLLGFTLLIFVHELGHFLAAKWAGIRVEQFAVGMGSPILSWRKGIGLVRGSTHEHVVRRTGKSAHELSDAELARYGLSETEYSLRWLPIGGFVKMLGQDDSDPAARSDDARSYTRCPVGKRMVVISAGVVMNVLLAIVLFMFVFLVGVRFDAPVVGQVAPNLPAATTVADNAEELGITRPGLQPGDRVISADRRQVRTFGDIQIASAMAKPDVPIRIKVERDGYDVPLQFTIRPEVDERNEGLLSIGVMPGSSLELSTRRQVVEFVQNLLDRTGLTDAGVEPGMTLIEVNGKPVSVFADLYAAAEDSEGEPLRTTWGWVGADGSVSGETIETEVNVMPRLEQLIHPAKADSGDVRSRPGGREGTRRGDVPERQFELGLLGFSPLVRVQSTQPDSPNVGVFESGDVIVRVAAAGASPVDGVAYPRHLQLLDEVRRHRRSTIEVDVLRNGPAGSERVTLEAHVNRHGMLGIGITSHLDEPITADPVKMVFADRSHGGARSDASSGEREPEGRSQVDDRLVPTLADRMQILPGTRILEINGAPIDDWAAFRAALIDAWNSHVERAEGNQPGHDIAETRIPVEFVFEHPTPGNPVERTVAMLEQDELARIARLGWDTPLASVMFESIYVTLHADGNPVRAVVLGFEQTWRFMVLTYATIDRLFRGTVGIEQLRGPIGIIHVGVQILDRGIMYLIFLLALISVNLAVLNFLPIPILDGGHMVMLIYEKIKGRPPSPAFQEVMAWGAILGLGTLFLIVTYHDIIRLFSG